MGVLWYGEGFAEENERTTRRRKGKKQKKGDAET